MAKHAAKLFNDVQGTCSYSLEKTPNIISTRLWYGTCVECNRNSESKIPEKINKIICLGCDKKLGIINISQKLPMLDKSHCNLGTDLKCRLCMNYINSNPYPIWGADEYDYSEKIFLCCSLRLSQDDQFGNNICQNCVLQLDYAYEFRNLCLKNNQSLSKSTQEKEENEILFANSVPYKEEIKCELENSSIESLVICDPENTDIEAEVQFECTECPMICYSEAELSLHKQSHLIGEKVCIKDVTSIYCQADRCEEQFKTFSDRSRHVKICHKHKGNVYNYICPYCAQKMKKLKAFKYHFDFLHSREEVACKDCDKVMNLENLKVHRKKVHLQAKFSCQFCNKNFSHKWKLKAHVRTHTGEMPYKCTDCPMAFGHRVTMKNHRLIIHNNNMFDSKKGGKISKNKKK